MSNILTKIKSLGDERDRELLKDATCFEYQPDLDLKVYAYGLDQEFLEAPKSVIIFFHGGLWDVSAPAQFVPQCLHLVSRGAICLVAETRNSARGDGGPEEAIEDARALVRWVKQNAELLKVDPDRVVVSGASGGAFLALHTALPNPKKIDVVSGVNSMPKALILFSAIVDTASPSGLASARFSTPKLAKFWSPLRHVRFKLPPMLFIHGKSDRIAPVTAVRRMVKLLKWRLNPVELIEYDKAEHSFFNFNVSHFHFELSIEALDHFLVKHGCLAACGDDEARIFSVPVKRSR